MDVNRSSLLLELISGLELAKSWCGETHIQKTVFFAKLLLNIPLNYQYVLYKYGPYSFELNEELTALRAYNYITIVPLPPYGVSMNLSNGENKLANFNNNLAQYKEKIDFIARKLGPKKVNELERVATVLYIKKCLKIKRDEEVAQKLNSLKPHISMEIARDAVDEYNMIEREAEDIFTELV